MNNTQKNTIQEIIDQALTEKTFSLEIIEKIKSLKDAFDKSVLDIETLNKRLEINDNLRLTLEKENITLRNSNESLIAKEKDVITREKELDKNKYELEFQKQRANEIKDILGIVFKNPVLQKSVFGSVPVERNGYIETHNRNENISETIN
jgi:hypothetical protein